MNMGGNTVSKRKKMFVYLSLLDKMFNELCE